jgi:hypothetical protein
VNMSALDVVKGFAPLAVPDRKLEIVIAIGVDSAVLP